MRKRLYRILVAVFLCIRKAEKTDADINAKLKLIQPFLLYHDSDLHYNRLHVVATKEIRENAEAYAQENPHSIVKSDYIMKQYIYLSAVRRKIYAEYFDNLRSEIVLNFYLTLEAYSAAVSFRVCAFFYRYVDRNWLKSSTCSDLSSYMEWYFSFMLKEKVEDLCLIKRFFIQKPNKPFKAEYVCKLLGKLNLDFLRFPGDQRSIDLLQDDENNIYKSDKLTLHNLETGEKSFISIFEKYRVPNKEDSERLDDYHKKVFYEIWKSIMDVYTDKFSVLLNYFHEVTRKDPHPVLPKQVIIKFVLKRTWDKMFEFYRIMSLPTGVQRGVVFEGNIESTIGNVIYRSNAVEILRQITYYWISPALINAGVQVYDIMTIINNGQLKCPLIVAPENLSVDYCMDIRPSKEMIPLLNH